MFLLHLYEPVKKPSLICEETFILVRKLKLLITISKNMWNEQTDINRSKEVMSGIWMYDINEL